MHIRNLIKRLGLMSILPALLLIGSAALSGCSAIKSPAASSATPSAATPAASSPASTSPSLAAEISPTADAAETMSQSIVYKNSDYGFDFTLPREWKGYTIVTEQWSGTPVGDSAQPGISGPKILIRSPKWTKDTPTQDIPIMVMTLDQYNAVLEEKYAVSAAPIPPSELGRNSKYVFALPARYNYAFLPGYEDVEKILEGKPLKPNENI